MKRLLNIYCDESCHIENKQITKDNRYMALGGIACYASCKDEVFQRIKNIKRNHGLTQLSEMKWTKVSKGKVEAYKDLIDYFFDNQQLYFRSIIIDKNQLNHDGFAEQTHDQFYYKMYWQMLEWFIEPSNRNHIYLDIKDTLGVFKVKELHKVLCNSQHDFDREIIERIQEVRSHEIAILQITDILIGAISYENRYGDNGKSSAKNEIVNLIKQRSGISLRKSTLPRAIKFNLFHWEGRKCVSS